MSMLYSNYTFMSNRINGVQNTLQKSLYDLADKENAVWEINDIEIPVTEDNRSISISFPNYVLCYGATDRLTVTMFNSDGTVYNIDCIIDQNASNSILWRYNGSIDNAYNVTITVDENRKLINITIGGYILYIVTAVRAFYE